MDFQAMTDDQIRVYVSAQVAAAMKAAGWEGVDGPDVFTHDARLWADHTNRAGLMRHENHGANSFYPYVEIPADAAQRLRDAQACFRW